MLQVVVLGSRLPGPAAGAKARGSAATRPGQRGDLHELDQERGVLDRDDGDKCSERGKAAAMIDSRRYSGNNREGDNLLVFIDVSLLCVLRGRRVSPPAAHLNNAEPRFRKTGNVPDSCDFFCGPPPNSPQTQDGKGQQSFSQN